MLYLAVPPGAGNLSFFDPRAGASWSVAPRVDIVGGLFESAASSMSYMQDLSTPRAFQPKATDSLTVPSFEDFHSIIRIISIIVCLSPCVFNPGEAAYLRQAEDARAAPA